MYRIEYDGEVYKFVLDDEIKTMSRNKMDLFNKVIKGSNSVLKASFKENSLNLFGLYVYVDKYNLIDNNIYICINNKKFKAKVNFSIRIPFTEYIIKYYHTEIKYSEIDQNAIYNPLFVMFENKDGYGFKKRMSYNILDRNKTKYRASKIKVLQKSTAVYLKQTKNNGLSIVFRERNATDTRIQHLKIAMAKFVSFFCKKNKIVLYEKELLKYEESSSILYEELLNQGYNNCYYIIDSKSEQISNIPSVYNKNIIHKCSFKNYLYFFTAKTFLGTEFIDHVIDLRVKNRHVEKFIASQKYNFVFLQHGVMYMLSLSSSARKFFKKGEIIGKNGKIVVSSVLEAEHFINDGGYNINDLYITGLPKFDKNYRYKNANKIVIMLTWRPWEYHEARVNPTNTTYYKSMMEIYDLIPENLKKNVIILPHPLFYSLVKDLNLFKVSDYNSYDEILKHTDLLITDYSSISIDAFSRGCNIIFWWKNIEESMKRYNGYLMLNRNNAYGDICETDSDLKDVIKTRYISNQSAEHISRYSKIVQFNDGKNTERLIEFLKSDRVI